MFTALALWPWIEQRWVTHDYGWHHLLDRPRDNPIRTGAGMMALVFYAFLLFAGGNDIIAKSFHISLYYTTYAFRWGLLIGPPVAYWATKRSATACCRRRPRSCTTAPRAAPSSGCRTASTSRSTARSPRSAGCCSTRTRSPRRRKASAPPPSPAVARRSRTGRRTKLADFFFTRSEPVPVTTDEDTDAVREPTHSD